MTTKLILIVFGSLLSLIGVLLLMLLNNVRGSFTQAKKDFLLKIDNLMTSYATMLNGELNDVMKRTKKNESDILGIKKDFQELKK
tara:strand:- start:56 stop:310 length:255 start_codon:yes stop_codon:yes gene_type:complete